MDVAAWGLELPPPAKSTVPSYSSVAVCSAPGPPASVVVQPAHSGVAQAEMTADRTTAGNRRVVRIDFLSSA
jgi:hypothetical protein